MMGIFFRAAMLTLSLVACGGDKDPQEQLGKLRGIGAFTSPLVSRATSDDALRVVELTAYATLPLDTTVTSLEGFVDKASPYAITLGVKQIKVKSDSLSYQSYPGFQLLTFKADLEVPHEQFFAPSSGAGQVRYGFIIKTDKAQEKMVGSFLVYPEDAPELAWINPEISVNTPAADTTIAAESEIEVNAVLKDHNKEELKLGWFVSDGEIKNRRASTTQWKTPAAGPHSLILTARGRKSRGFSLQVITLTVE
jgi:hypothetical protein